MALPIPQNIGKSSPVSCWCGDACDTQASLFLFGLAESHSVPQPADRRRSPTSLLQLSARGTVTRPSVPYRFGSVGNSGGPAQHGHRTGKVLTAAVPQGDRATQVVGQLRVAKPHRAKERGASGMRHPFNWTRPVRVRRVSRVITVRWLTYSRNG